MLKEILESKLTNRNISIMKDNKDREFQSAILNGKEYKDVIIIEANDEYYLLYNKKQNYFEEANNYNDIVTRINIDVNKLKKLVKLL